MSAHNEPLEKGKIFHRGNIRDGEPHLLLCHCGRTVELYDPLNNDCQCGRTYNLFGQEIANPRGLPGEFDDSDEGTISGWANFYLEQEKHKEQPWRGMQ